MAARALSRHVACLSLLAFLSGCGSPAGGSGSGLRVATTLYPVSFVVRAVGGSHAAVDDVVPAGADPHDLELTPRQVVELSEADLVVYVGGGFQPAVERAIADAEVAVLDVLDASGLPAAAGTADPHVWLDPVAMAEVAGAVGRRLADLDPAHARAYRRNAAALERDLRGLHDDVAAGLVDCAGDTIVTAHEAFGHLARRYGLEEVGIAGPDPESEPSPQRIADVVELVRRRRVPVVFAERGAPARLVEAVADETGVSTAVLDSLEAPPAGGYLAGMRANLQALRDGLGCR